MARVFTQEEITSGLLAVIAWAGSPTAASRDLKSRGINISNSTLKQWVDHTHQGEYERLRDEHAPALEARLAHEYRNVAQQSVSVQQLALEQAHKRLVAGEDPEPARTASFAARTGQSAVDKLMTLTQRPQKITEDRDINEVLRSLAAMKVITALPAPVDAEVVDD